MSIVRKEEVGQRGELERPSAVSPIKGGRRGLGPQEQPRMGRGVWGEDSFKEMSEP